MRPASTSHIPTEGFSSPLEDNSKRKDEPSGPPSIENIKN
jgi:hypothetical protein